jgi:hypothetical protein
LGLLGKVLRGIASVADSDATVLDGVRNRPERLG